MDLSKLRGKLIMFDGIDKGGKGTAAAGLRDWVEQQGMHCFDLVTYQKKEKSLPESTQLDGFDSVISAEPTYCWSGCDLREEHLLDNGREYEAEETAELFSANRCTLYRRLVLPALKQGKCWIQERGVITSLVYQPVQAAMRNKHLERTYIESLAGNRLALQNPPHLIILVHCDPRIAASRVRKKKNDNAFFEKINYLSSLAKEYHDPWVRSYFESLDSYVIELDTTSWTPKQTVLHTIDVVKEYLSKL